MGWPDDFSEQLAGRDCSMCVEQTDENPFGIRLLASPYSSAYLQRAAFQSTPGYTVVIWRGSHVVDIQDLSDEDARGYLGDVVAVSRALAQHFRPIKLNHLLLGNAVPHLHTHVIPRYPDDPSPGGPLIPPADPPGQWSDEELRPHVDLLTRMVQS